VASKLSAIGLKWPAHDRPLPTLGYVTTNGRNMLVSRRSPEILVE
jgi:hypothetical protein